LGLKRNGLALVKQYLGKKVLCLSYPDLVMPPGEVCEVLGIQVDEYTDHGAWHKVPYRLAETAAAFRKAGVEELKFIDINASRGCESIVDLNVDDGLILGGWYDLVIDPGTTEHCFNVGVAVRQAASAVAVGGVIVHTPPVSMVNHGFWNFNPTALYDFYSQNGWEILEMLLADGNEGFHKCPRTARFGCPPELSIYFAARRLSPAPLTWPTQSKYLNNPNL
jgi:hypothetical protein